MNKDKIKITGTIAKVLGKGKFTVETNGEKIECHPSGKMRKYFIKIIEGDKVDVELSPYDLKRGRIIYRYK